MYAYAYLRDMIDMMTITSAKYDWYVSIVITSIIPMTCEYIKVVLYGGVLGVRVLLFSIGEGHLFLQPDGTWMAITIIVCAYAGMYVA